jgi:hypothetical protein
MKAFIYGMAGGAAALFVYKVVKRIYRRHRYNTLKVKYNCL